MAEQDELNFYPEVSLTDGTALLVDDDDTIRSMVRAYLEEEELFTRFFEARNGLEGFQVLANHFAEIDVVLCDVEMPEFDGFKFLQMRTARPEYTTVPTILVTGRGEVEARVKGLKLGAADYLQKPVVKEELRLRARNQMHIRRLQQRLRETIAELRHVSLTDALTELPNRRHFVEVFAREYARAQRYEHPLALLILDIDHFKRINDTYGHLVGDRVLRGVADVLKYGLRQSDFAGRWGGEEFAVLLPETDLESGVLVAERYRREIAQRRFHSGSERFGITISVGVAAWPESEPADPEDLLRRADTALYAAKEAGRNRVVRALPEGPVA